MAKLNKLTVKGFKSIKSLEDFELRNLNVLIGANGAGKSNFISLFRFLQKTYQGERLLNDFINVQGGVDRILHFGRKHTQDILVELGFDNITLELKYKLTNDNRLFFYSETAYPSQGTIEKAQNLIEQNILNQKIYHFHDTSDTALVKSQSSLNDNLALKSDAENLAPYLYMLKANYPNEYQRIVDTIRLVLPFFDDFVQRKSTDLVELEWFQKGRNDTPLKAHILSDGSLRFICLMTLLLQPLELLPDTILIDEPELGLHPYAIAILADVIKQVSEEKQIIISTQSVELVNYFEPNDVVVVNQKEGVSDFERLDNEMLESWLDDYSLGELWKSNLLGGRP